jgi:hypothetical protein
MGRMAPICAAAALLGLAAPPSASAKEFVSLAVTGAAGDSLVLRGTDGLVESIFDGASPFNRGRQPRPAPARGGYVRLYPLDRWGFSGIPGRFYPESGAACFDWLQWRRPTACRRPNRALLRLLAPAARLSRYRGRPTTVAGLRQPRLPPGVRRQLFVDVELAFDRSRLARPASRPQACIPFGVRWSGPAAASRPGRFCLAAQGVFANGLVYPLGRGPWSYARINLRS